jgi:hypothetical protein
MSDKTIVENLGLFHAHQVAALRQIRRELRRLERRSWWMRFKAKFRRKH